jgi:hypothetical protein
MSLFATLVLDLGPAVGKALLSVLLKDHPLLG